MPQWEERQQLFTMQRTGMMRMQESNKMREEKPSNAEVVLERGHAMTTLNIIHECWQGSSSCEV